MRKELTYDDAIALSKLPAVEVAVPFLEITNNFFGQKIMVSGGGKTSASVALQGTLPDFEKAGTQIISDGRFFSQFENDTNTNVCVIGSKVAEDFFKFGKPVAYDQIGSGIASSACYSRASSSYSAVAATSKQRHLYALQRRPQAETNSDDICWP
jgi:hypothetical protein